MKNRTLHCTSRVFALAVVLLVFAFRAVAGPVDAQRARLVAKNFLNINDARSTGLRDISAEAGFANVYVFSTDNSFVLVPADDRLQPVLGYSLNGKFDYENMPENKAAWIQEYSDAVAYAIEHQTRATDEVLQQWNDLAAGRTEAWRAVDVVSPLLSTQWGQGDPYNLLCPSGTVTGCVATAMAQIMRYYMYPVHGIGSHSYTPSTHPEYGEQTANFQETAYQWALMTPVYNFLSLPIYKTAVATLMYHCGVSVDMDYNTSSAGGSAAVTADVADAAKKYFNYSQETQHISRSGYTDWEWTTMLKNNLDQGWPLQYHGSHSVGGGGHSFVCDGYNILNFFHINWGWTGSYDEYYSINNLTPGSGGIGAGMGIYDANHGAIFNFHPSTCTAAAPTNLAYTQNGRNVTFTWTAVSGASSYNVYCDHVLLGNATGTSLTVQGTYGTHPYWVRSVDADGEMSLSSNVVTVTVDYPTPVVDDLTAVVTNNNVTLNWTAPDWSYPPAPTASFTYGDGSYNGSLGYNNSSLHMYWGHRYPASALSSYDGKGVYRVSFHTLETGNYKVYVFRGTTSNHPQTLVHQQALTVDHPGWVDIDLTSIVTIDASKDLWVFIYDSEGREHPASYCTYSGNEGCYYGTSPILSINTYVGIAFNIRTYVSDGIYTYNIYRNGTCLDSNVGSTSYNDNGLAPGTYNYTVKTNYYGGETAASNVATALIGSGTSYTISASVNPAESGTVTGAGAYLEGNTCMLTATANPGYQFVNWTKNGTVVSTTNPYSFTVTEAATYVANFEVSLDPVTIQVGTGTQTNSYFPFYTYYCKSIATALFRASELQAAGILTTPMLSLSWYATTASTMEQTNITIWMANVSDTEASTTSPAALGMTEVYTGSITPEVGWNTFTLNEAPFAWDGTSNVLILCQRNHGSWENPEVQWQSHQTSYNSISYNYNDTNPYNVENGVYTMTLGDLRPNTRFEMQAPGSGTTQTATLSNGWSWWSTYIEQEGIDGLTMLENSLGNACTRIQSRTKFIDNNEYMGYHFWDGTLTAINNEESYRIRTNAACQAVVTGAVTTPAAHPITVNPGWNWIGFPSSQPLGVTAALSSFSPVVNDQIKGRNNFATYLGNYGGVDYWDGYLTTLEPGQGYMYKSNATTAKTLVYQTGSKTVLLPNGTTKDNFYTPVCEEYADNMTLIAEVEIDGTALRSEYELAAFAGNECRGSVKLKYVEPLDRYLAFLMVFGDGEEALSFVLTDGEETLWSNESLMFTANGALGTPAEPLVLYFGTTGVDESEQVRINIYPNPSNGVFNVEGNGIQRVEVLNAMGQTLFIQETQDNRIQIDLSGKAKGMYLLRVVTENGILSNQLLKY